MLQFAKHPTRDETLVSRRRIWRSKCRWYRVAHYRCRYGPRSGPQAMPEVYYAQKFDAAVGVWDILKRCRTKTAAIKVCEKDEKPKRR